MAKDRFTPLTPERAVAEGYTVDSHCYPWAAYKGPRFRPDEIRQCLTHKEALMYAALEIAEPRMRAAGLNTDWVIAALAAARGEGE